MTALVTNYSSRIILGTSSLLAVAATLELDSISPPPDTVEEETQERFLMTMIQEEPSLVKVTKTRDISKSETLRN
jgi:hypothetical protein